MMAYIPEDLENTINIIITYEEAEFILQLLHKSDHRVLKSIYQKVQNEVYNDANRRGKIK